MHDASINPSMTAELNAEWALQVAVKTWHLTLD